MHRVSLRAALVRLLVLVILFSGMSRGRAQSTPIDSYASAVNGIVWTALVVVGVGVYFIARASANDGMRGA